MVNQKVPTVLTIIMSMIGQIHEVLISPKVVVKENRRLVSRKAKIMNAMKTPFTYVNAHQ